MKKNDAWYKRVLIKQYGEMLWSLAFLTSFIIVLLIWNFFTGKSFEWQDIAPIDQPSLFHKLLYSALVYVTLGAALYKMGFYKFLYSLYKGTKNGWREYKKTKAGIWALLMLLMFFVIVPTVVNILNFVISVGYNLFILFLYIFPAATISLLLLFFGYIAHKKLQRN